MNTNEYLQSLNSRLQQGHTSEHTFRGDLEQLLHSLLPRNHHIINEPSKISDCGNPDYVITHNKIPIGYIEAKDIGKDLNHKLYSEQFNRYRNALDNLIITDYVWFQFFENGEKVAEIRLGDLSTNNKSIIASESQFQKFANLIADFASKVTQSIKSPVKLAELMAGKARLLENILEEALTTDIRNNNTSPLTEQFSSFKKMLIHDLEPKDFSDLYAQTLAYGLFAARYHDQTLSTFNRDEAARLIPQNNPLLRNLFQSIAGYNIDERIEPTVDNLAEVFRHADVKTILEGYGKKTAQTDPIIHFYETFLAKYDAKLRKAKGVWYTPQPVVGFIVRAVDDILKSKFDIKDGIADSSKTTIELDSQIPDSRTKSGYKSYEKEIHRVQILDPATGTGTFLAEVVDHIYDSRFKHMKGAWPGYVKQDLIPRLNGFELLMASYAMAHLKLDILLGETGCDIHGLQQRLRIFLTNSLEEYHPDTQTLFASWLSDEAREANAVKKDTPVMVIMGNPPYSGESSNKGDWIMSLMDDYKKEPGGKEKLKERNSKWINDDYVKFMRFAQHFIEKNEEGVLAFINPHGFLDNPTFRGMRWNLLKTYDEIFSIDLHGNAKKKEVCPDGSKDENVFDIEQGVSINLLIKTGRKKKNELGKFYHHDLFGRRKDKYLYLEKTAFSDVPYKELPNVEPMYFMVPKDFDLQKDYNNGFSIHELFPIRSVGIATARDNFTVHPSKKNVRDTINSFLSLSDEEARTTFNLGKDSRDWKIHLAREDLYNSENSDHNIVPITYRPFDSRFTYFTGNSKGFHCMPRGTVMKHMLKEDNIALSFNRQIEQKREFADIFIFDELIQHHSLSIKEVNYLAPLYVHPDDGSIRVPNLNPDTVKVFEKALKISFVAEKKDFSIQQENFSPIDILDYIYAVLHSPSYRKRYAPFLKTDFPRVPYPKAVIFWQLVSIGREIRLLHLMKSITLDEIITCYPLDGNNIVDRKITKTSPGYEAISETHGKVWVNEKQYFDEVPLLAWEFCIGGYQPAQKWLKDRYECELSYEDILHYQKIIFALTDTHRLMLEVDKIFNI